MRILVADQNTLLLAAIAATFGRHCEIVTATRRDDCMAHVEQRHFDVVVACEKLVGYTGLELLSEVEATSPATLRIFAARPETLQRLGKQLDFFGLLGTLHYPIEARKLLIALKVARGKLPGRSKPPVVKHIVLENEWDTGERLALLGQELEEAPSAKPEEAAHVPAADAPATTVRASTVPPANVLATTVPAASVLATEPLDYVDDGAANDELFSHAVAAAQARGNVAAGQAAPSAQASQPYAAAALQASGNASAGQAGTSKPASVATTARFAAPESVAVKPAPIKPAASKAAAAKPTIVNGPRPRQPTVLTAAQREVFQRALARRNAARAGGMVEAPPIDFSSMTPMSATRPAAAQGSGPAQNLADLARMATTKRPLPGVTRKSATGGARHPKRRVFVIGSGIAAVLLAGVVTFELLRTTQSHEHGIHGGRAANLQLFSAPSTSVGDNSAGAPQVFSPSPSPSPSSPPPQSEAQATASNLPQPQTFDPDTAPPDPPPPPALEHPGPMEPPSMAHNAPPWAPQVGSYDE